MPANAITVISTGIGTDNIDIVFNELDALANIDFKSREIKPAEKNTEFYTGRYIWVSAGQYSHRLLFDEQHRCWV